MSSLMGRGDVVRGDPLLPPTSPQETSELIAKMRGEKGRRITPGRKQPAAFEELSAICRGLELRVRELGKQKELRPVSPSVSLGPPHAPFSTCMWAPPLAAWLRAHAAQLHPEARSTARCLSRDVCHGLGNLDFVQNTPNLRNELEGFKSRK